jgi:hypothetical protein
MRRSGMKLSGKRGLFTAGVIVLIDAGLLVVARDMLRVLKMIARRRALRLRYAERIWSPMMGLKSRIMTTPPSLWQGMGYLMATAR